jgi:hypothetical protein
MPVNFEIVINLLIPENGNIHNATMRKKGQHPLHLATLWYDGRQKGERSSNGEKGVFKNSSPLGKNPEPTCTITGYFA